MKKIIFASILLFWIFAIQNTDAACYPNVRYNWERVFLCEGNNSESNYNYYRNNWSYYNSDDENSYPYYANDNYYENLYWDYNNYYDWWVNSSEENNLKIKYLNWLWWPWEDNSVKKDFFKNNVIWNWKELWAIDAIKVKSVKYKISSRNDKYNDAVRFFDALKEEIKTRYNEWKISYNQIYDIKNDLETLVYNLNNQFEFYKKYETTKSNTYKEMAEDSAEQVRTWYDKLKFTLANL